MDQLAELAKSGSTSTTVDVIETHISWVILTEAYAYKIKKPLVLDFLDFGSLEKRKFYCDEEIRLNRPWAPELYLDVVPITLADGTPQFGGTGPPIEFAVRMRRFAQELQLDVQLEQDKLTMADMRELGRAMAVRHTGADVVSHDQRDRQVAKTIEFIWDNFSALDGVIDKKLLSQLSAWTEHELSSDAKLLWQRFDNGFVRDCHGDLHLANLVRLPSGITSFDCIEFDANLRNIDVICDIAFLIMDLVARKRHDLASHFLNRYLESTGDYGGVALLDLYFVYRCLVRAKVATIFSLECNTTREKEIHLAEAHRYCDMAWRQANKRNPMLVVMHGLSGSGKTWLSEQLMAAMPAIRVRSDIERKRKSGLAELANSQSDLNRGIYTKAASAELYSNLLDSARTLLGSGHNVILDATFLDRETRTEAYALADGCGCHVVLLHVDAPNNVMKQRVRKRGSVRGDASEADLAVLEHQIVTAGALSPEDHERLMTYDNTSDADVAALVTELRLKRERPLRT